MRLLPGRRQACWCMGWGSAACFVRAVPCPMRGRRTTCRARFGRQNTRRAGYAPHGFRMIFTCPVQRLTIFELSWKPKAASNAPCLTLTTGLLAGWQVVQFLRHAPSANCQRIDSMSTRFDGCGAGAPTCTDAAGAPARTDAAGAPACTDAGAAGVAGAPPALVRACGATSFADRAAAGIAAGCDSTFGLPAAATFACAATNFASNAATGVAGACGAPTADVRVRSAANFARTDVSSTTPAAGAVAC
eukprot:334001-Chlamydomonas_euryale.AAC.3